jgi:succinyl-diaminopimelate desuccinylase
VTPKDAGALDVLEKALTRLGFDCHRLRFTEAGTPPVDNLYAHIGDTEPRFCFAGHTDVVPTGDLSRWSVDPFAATLKDNRLYGRGASDMKSAIAAFVCAVERLLAVNRDIPGSIHLLITGDEEGPAINGTRKMLDWLSERGTGFDFCLVGEPTSRETLGDIVKIGRRGSLNVKITAHGQQGRVAYPHLADNPISRLVAALALIDTDTLDAGTAHFQPSTLTLTSIDVGNPTTNVIPAEATARLNIRFNDTHTADDLQRWLDERLRSCGDGFTMDVTCSAEPFVSPPGRFTDIVQSAVADVSEKAPKLSTSGGTSDARFIKNVCPVVELGMLGTTAHQIDEWIPAGDVEKLTAIYERILQRAFSGSGS